MKETLEELLKRDLEAWLVAKAAIEKARRSYCNVTAISSSR